MRLQHRAELVASRRCRSRSRRCVAPGRLLRVRDLRRRCPASSRRSAPGPTGRRWCPTCGPPAPGFWPGAVLDRRAAARVFGGVEPQAASERCASDDGNDQGGSFHRSGSPSRGGSQLVNGTPGRLAHVRRRDRQALLHAPVARDGGEHAAPADLGRVQDHLPVRREARATRRAALSVSTALARREIEHRDLEAPAVARDVGERLAVRG